VILSILVDDLGHYDTSATNPNAPTLNIGALADEGLRLSRHYAYKWCSPSRRSFLSGRFPVHISGEQASTCSNYLPTNFTLLSGKLKQAGFMCHFIGKGHLGYQTEDHLPINRGFDSHVGYLGGGQHYSYGLPNVEGKFNPQQDRDFWHDHAPAEDVLDEVYYSTNWYSERAVGIIQAHDVSKPLWLHLSYQAVHAPRDEVPSWERHEFDPQFCGGLTIPISNMSGAENCRIYADMLWVMDSGVGNVTRALRERGLWDETLVLVSSDNGGMGPGNNYPLRGQKTEPWEGGTRVVAFLAGGFLPAGLAGTTSDVFIHIADWYATFASLVGVDSSDTDRTSYDIDSINIWPYLTGEAKGEPREFLPITEGSIIWKSQYKLMINAEATHDYTKDCGRTKIDLVCTPANPCLFDLLEDPGEQKNIQAAHPDIVTKLLAKLQTYEVYTSASMSDEELRPYQCVPYIKDSNFWWNQKHGYRGIFLGPCCSTSWSPCFAAGRESCGSIDRYQDCSTCMLQHSDALEAAGCNWTEHTKIIKEVCPTEDAPTPPPSPPAQCQQAATVQCGAFTTYDDCKSCMWKHHTDLIAAGCDWDNMHSKIIKSVCPPQLQYV